jgi:hypothetical protein
MADLYLDENVSRRMMTALATHGHRAMHARDLLPDGTSDHIHFGISARVGWPLVTHNRDDFALLHRAWRDWPAFWTLANLPLHAGILLLPQPPILTPAAAASAVDALILAVGGVGGLKGRLYTWSSGVGWLDESAA